MGDTEPDRARKLALTVVAIAEIVGAANDVTRLHKPMPQMDQLQHAHTTQVERRMQQLKEQRESATRAANEPRTSQRFDDEEMQRQRRNRSRDRTR